MCCILRNDCSGGTTRSARRSLPPLALQYPYMANPYGAAYPYGAGYGGYAQPGAPAYPPQVCVAAATGRGARFVCHLTLLLHTCSNWRCVIRSCCIAWICLLSAPLPASQPPTLNATAPAPLQAAGQAYGQQGYGRQQGYGLYEDQGASAGGPVRHCMCLAWCRVTSSRSEVQSCVAASEHS